MPEEPPGTVKPCDLWLATPHIQSVMHDKHAPGSTFIHFLQEESGGEGRGGLLEIEGKRAEASGSRTPHLTFILHDRQISREEINSALSGAVTSVRSEKNGTQMKGHEKKRGRSGPHHHTSVSHKWEKIADF